MRRLLLAISATLFALAIAIPALADGTTVQVAKDPKLGSFLVDSKGMTLYLYTKDTPNTSNCYDQCATNWPPLYADGNPTAPADVPGTLGVTTRKDGKKQVTYNGWPLYYWVKDTKPGDTTGQGVGNVWYVLEPKATTSAPLPKAGGFPAWTLAALGAVLAVLGIGARQLSAVRSR